MEEIIKNKSVLKKFAGKRVWLAVIIAAVLMFFLIMLFSVFAGGSADSAKNIQTFKITRGDLPITVIAGGAIKALNSKDITCEVEGKTTIINIVEEGTYITLEDVNNGKVLVELDSSNIKQKLTEQQITFSNAQSGLTEAEESLDIQIKQNESDIRAGEMKARFALIDLKKYVGENVAELLISDANKSSDVNVAKFLIHPQLGGAALQKLKELTDEITLGQSKYERATDKLNWTQKLFEKKYVAETELRADELEVQSQKVQKEKAEIALQLFKLYEFPKETEKLLSDYKEALRELERVQASTRSKLAQAQAKLENAKATYELQKELLEKWRKQFNACTIKAPSAGQAVYASSMREFWDRQNPIQEGAEVYERQKILAIPDLTSMKIEVKIHEVWIDKVQLGQIAAITFAAYPEKAFTGKVVKKAPLSDPESWFDPDLKLYTADVVIDGTHEFMKTGMTTKVEIAIDQLKNVLTVPLQAVVNRDGKKFCYVLEGKQQKQCEVTIGAFNDNFVEIKSGLTEGQNVILNPPRAVTSKNNFNKI